MQQFFFLHSFCPTCKNVLKCALTLFRSVGGQVALYLEATGDAIKKDVFEFMYDLQPIQPETFSGKVDPFLLHWFKLYRAILQISDNCLCDLFHVCSFNGIKSVLIELVLRRFATGAGPLEHESQMVPPRQKTITSVWVFYLLFSLTFNHLTTV